MARALSDKVISGLIYLHKYRFFTIAHFAKITGFSLYHSAEVLRDFERWGMVGFIGNVFIPGAGRTPKVYYLMKKGFALLSTESREFNGIFTDIPGMGLAPIQSGWDYIKGFAKREAW